MTGNGSRPSGPRCSLSPVGWGGRGLLFPPKMTTLRPRASGPGGGAAGLRVIFGGAPALRHSVRFRRTHDCECGIGYFQPALRFGEQFRSGTLPPRRRGSTRWPNLGLEMSRPPRWAGLIGRVACQAEALAKADRPSACALLRRKNYYLRRRSAISLAALRPLISMPPKIGPMRYPPETLFALMPQAKSPG